jgi:glyoxalase family protein
MVNNNSGKSSGVLGIHHVTAIAKNPQRNIDFYSGILGLRLVKLTVNFDDPTTYHLYYGDSLGHPGTILTFFPWPDAPKGYRGTGEVTAISFLIPPGSMKYWTDRLRQNGISFIGPSNRFDDQYLSFYDHDGLTLELISPSENSDNISQSHEGIWEDSPVSPEYAIRGFHSATLSEEGFERTEALLTDTMGFKLIAKDSKEGRFRFKVEIDDSDSQHNTNSSDAGKPYSPYSTHRPIGSIIDIVCQPDISSGYIGIGTVHHIAWRTADDRHQLDLRKRIINDAHLNPTPVIDRTYFHSVYFREPGGILFEIATDPPGFTIDERSEDLGKQLRLPKWLEPMRSRLEKVLPPVNVSLEKWTKNPKKERIA